MILEVERRGGSESTMKGLKEKEKAFKSTQRKKRENARDQLAFRDENESFIYISDQSKVRIRVTEDIETTCKLRTHRTTSSTGEMKGKAQE